MRLVGCKAPDYNRAIMVTTINVVFFFVALLSPLGMLASIVNGNMIGFAASLSAFMGSAIILLLCEILDRLPKPSKPEPEKKEYL